MSMHRKIICIFFVTIIQIIHLAEAGTIDLEANPVTGFLESVGLDGTGRIIHVIDSGGMGKQTAKIVSVVAGLEPRLSIAENGDTSVIWLDESGSLFYRRRVLATKSWDPVVNVAVNATADTSPAIGAAGNDAWVAYETEIGGVRTIEALEIIDSAEPFGASWIASVEESEELDPRVFREAGEVWIVWDDGVTQLAWSALDAASSLWSAPQAVVFDPENKTAAYLTIRDLVIAP